MALNAQVNLSLLAHETSSGDLSSTIRVTPASYNAAMVTGTGANQAQVVWSATRTLAGASQTLNLAALPSVRDGVTATVTITAVKALYVKNTGTASLSFAGAPFPSSGQTVAAGAVAVQCDPSAAGMSASGVTVTGSAGCAYDIMLIGEGSVS